MAAAVARPRWCWSCSRSAGDAVDDNVSLMRRFALAATLIGALASPAGANGRAPATSTIHFRQGNDQDVIAGMTFGAVLSHDGGATWQWMCEAAVGYGGMYDPSYQYTASGA